MSAAVREAANRQCIAVAPYRCHFQQDQQEQTPKYITDGNRSNLNTGPSISLTRTRAGNKVAHLEAATKGDRRSNASKAKINTSGQKKKHQSGWTREERKTTKGSRDHNYSLGYVYDVPRALWRYGACPWRHRGMPNWRSGSQATLPAKQTGTSSNRGSSIRP